MIGLGYHRFGAQGGDWGSSVATCLGFAHAATVVGIHLGATSTYLLYITSSAPNAIGFATGSDQYSCVK